MTDDVLRGIDAPRPLPAHVRAALEERLLTPDDEVAGLLRSAEAPRALPAGTRDVLERQLVRRRFLPAWVVAAAAAGVLVAGTLAALPSPPAGAPAAQPAAPVASPEGLVPPPPRSAAAGASAAASPAAVVPLITPRPSPLPPAAGSSQAPGSAGVAAGATGGAPAAAGPTRGVTSVAPDEGPVDGGTRITLSGHGLSRAVRVDLGDRAGSDLVVESDTRLSVVTPAAGEPGRASITVHLSTGEVYLFDPPFTYLAAPTVTALDPDTGPSTGGNVVVVTGRHFTERIAVSFGDTAARDVEVLSDSELRVVAPAHLPGPVEITVTTAGGTSNSEDYLYRP